MPLMKSIVHKIGSLIMAFVVFVSTMSFTIDTHYCGATLIDTAIFTKAKSCGMEMPNSSSKNASITKKNCCNDYQIIIEGQDNLQQAQYTTTYKEQLIVASFAYSYLHVFGEFQKRNLSFKEYSPPLVVKDIQQLDQVYLI